MSIQWDDRLATGIERIDAEHRVFVALIGELEQADADGAPHERMERILREIHAYAVFHFVREENLMTDCGYPERDRHRSEHKRLLVQYANVLHEYREGRVLVQHIVELVYGWFAEHAAEADQRLADYLRRNAD
jgi:hemerythrin